MLNDSISSLAYCVQNYADDQFCIVLIMTCVKSNKTLVILFSACMLIIKCIAIRTFTLCIYVHSIMSKSYVRTSLIS